MEQQIKIIGMGGVGCALLPHLCRFLTYSGQKSRLYLIDGDDFEWRNLERQSFTRLGNKAEVKAEELAREGEPQLLFANLMVATLMLGAYYAILEGKLDYEEAYFDIVSGKVSPVKRGLGGGRDGPET